MLILPSVMFHYFVDVSLSRNLDVVSSLLNVEAIKAFDYSKFVEFIDHVVLYLLFDLKTQLHGFGTNDEIVDLLE